MMMMMMGVGGHSKYKMGDNKKQKGLTNYKTLAG